MFKQSKALGIVTTLFVIFLVWRLILYFVPAPAEDTINMWSFAWGAGYQIIAIVGALTGFAVSRAWGGWKSLLGRTIIVFSFGLLLQCFGQTISSYYVYTLGEIPYPSWGDIGFFGSVLFYIVGAFMLARLSGVHISIRSFSSKILAFLIPLAGLIVSYIVFLKGYERDWSVPFTAILDLGYPLGQAFYVSVALLVYSLSRNVLGGVMRTPILLFLIALAAQYISDFTFLYQVTRQLYIPEGINDLMYFVSYFLMAISLIRLGAVFKNISNT